MRPKPLLLLHSANHSSPKTWPPGELRRYVRSQLSSVVVTSIAETPDARQIAPAAPGEFESGSVGPKRIWPPVILAPMAGVTNYPFRSLCRELGAPVCVGEMVTARPLVHRVARTLSLAAFGESESPRSIQLYGTDPHWVSLATRYLVDELGAGHIDLNFGCPVRKVTAQGGGAALPHKPLHLAKINRAAVSTARGIPITAKFRLGIDDQHLVYLQTGRIAEQEGCAAIALHARTAAQLYSGHANWNAIGELKQAVGIPVFGNGDIWEAADAIRMMRQTRCDGVVVGRGCLGRPWLFRDLSRMFSGSRPSEAPKVGAVLEIMLEHARRQANWMGEKAGVIAFRRQAAWYTKGMRASAELRQRLVRIDSLDGLAQAVTSLDPNEPFPQAALRVPRCKDAGTQRVSLPAGYLDDPFDDTSPAEHDAHDGG